MKKFLFLTLFSLLTVFNLCAQWTPDQTIPVWQRRFVPPANEVDSTFSSINFKTDNPAYVYADPMNFFNAACCYGTGDMDSMQTRIVSVKDGSNVTYTAVKYTAANVVGYPAYGASQNVVIVTPSVTSSTFTPSDTFDVTVNWNMLTPSGGTGIDSVRITVYTSSTASGTPTNDTTILVHSPANTWGSYTATFQINTPVNTNVQTIIIVFEPKFGAKNDTVSIANMGAKISQ